jgi:hypothetical protein
MNLQGDLKMLLEEMQERLKNTDITDEQLRQLNPIYLLLDFHKDDFCKLIKAVGINKWLDKADYWKRLEVAEQELSAKEHYLKAKSRLADIELEKAGLEEIVNGYKPV